MRLYLVRHAIAELADAQKWPDDSSRPLSQRGRKRFRKAARGVGRLGLQVDVVLSSPFVRAWDTALMLEEGAGWPHPLPCEELASGSTAAVIGALQPHVGAQSVAMVGHEPALSRVASTLLAPRAGNFLALKRGAVVCLDLEGESEQSPRAELRWVLPPRVLRAIR